MASILNTSATTMPVEFIGHQGACIHCGSTVVVESTDTAYMHTASHLRMDDSQQLRTVRTPCPQCSGMRELLASVPLNDPSALDAPDVAPQPALASAQPSTTRSWRDLMASAQELHVDRSDTDADGTLICDMCGTADDTVTGRHGTSIQMCHACDSKAAHHLRDARASQADEGDGLVGVTGADVDLARQRDPRNT